MALLRNSFTHMDEMLMGSGQYDNVGCTAVACLINNKTITVANVGDSRAVLSRNGQAVDLSQDHKPNLPKEAARIHKAGGHVTEHRKGGHTVHRVNGGLAISRSLGDAALKNNTKLNASDQLVSGVPDVGNCRREPGDEFIIIASQGVWGVLSSQQAVDRVRRDLASIKSGDLQPADVVQNILCECLSDDSSEALGTDNMTMVLIVFDNKAAESPSDHHPHHPHLLWKSGCSTAIERKKMLGDTRNAKHGYK
jgi:protein phosphatase 1G